MKIKFILILAFLLAFKDLKAQNPKVELPIQTIELVHYSHTDMGYTDNPMIAIDLHKRYIDIALDAIIETADSASGKKFYWTAEALEPVYA